MMLHARMRICTHCTPAHLMNRQTHSQSVDQTGRISIKQILVCVN